MNQEFIIGNLKLVQDDECYGISRKIAEGTWEAIATFKYPEDAIAYFNGIVMNVVAYQQNKQVEERLDKIPEEEL